MATGQLGVRRIAGGDPCLKGAAVLCRRPRHARRPQQVQEPRPIAWASPASPQPPRRPARVEPAREFERFVAAGAGRWERAAPGGGTRAATRRGGGVAGHEPEAKL